MPEHLVFDSPNETTGFEVFCAVCGYGMCYESYVRYSYGRHYPHIVVGNCPICVERIKKEALDKSLEK